MKRFAKKAEEITKISKKGCEWHNNENKIKKEIMSSLYWNQCEEIKELNEQTFHQIKAVLDLQKIGPEFVLKWYISIF